MRVSDDQPLNTGEDGTETNSEILGLKQGATSDIPPMLGQPATSLTVDLDQFSPDSARSWTSAVTALRDRFGPFTLAYLETLVRISDWRGSGARELATDIYAIDNRAKEG
jgi:CRISPR-associated endonuclease/helicase Cas3